MSARETAADKFRRDLRRLLEGSPDRGEPTRIAHDASPSEADAEIFGRWLRSLAGAAQRAKPARTLEERANNGRRSPRIPYAPPATQAEKQMARDFVCKTGGVASVESLVPSDAGSPVGSCSEANAKLVGAFERYMVAMNLAEGTRSSRLRAIRAFGEYLGAESFAEADHCAVRTFLAQSTDPRTRIESVRAFYKFLTFGGVMSSAPIRLPRVPKRASRLPRFLTESEIDRLISCAQTPRDRALVELLYASGLRSAEASNLHADQMNLDGGTLLVVRGKGNKDRVALLGSKAVGALRDYLCGRTSGPVFLNASGHSLDKRALHSIIARMAVRAGLKNVGPHTIRHSVATHLLNRGADIRYVQEFLGHARISTTQIYTHVATADAVATYTRSHPHAGGDGQ